jgi:hypothetical protein
MFSSLHVTSMPIPRNLQYLHVLTSVHAYLPVATCELPSMFTCRRIYTLDYMENAARFWVRMYS